MAFDPKLPGETEATDADAGRDTFDALLRPATSGIVPQVPGAPGAPGAGPGGLPGATPGINPAQTPGFADRAEALATAAGRVAGVTGGKVASVSSQVATVSGVAAAAARGPNLLQLADLAAPTGIAPPGVGNTGIVPPGVTAQQPSFSGGAGGAGGAVNAPTARSGAGSVAGAVSQFSSTVSQAAGAVSAVRGAAQARPSAAQIAGAAGAALNHGQPLLEVKVDSGDILDIRQFSVDEKLSSLFTIHLTAVSENPDISFDDVVGKPAKFTLRSSQHTRNWSGVCNHLQQIRVEETGASTYELTLVPTLWLLTQRRNYRMFQQMSEPDIVLEILSEWQIEPEVKLTETYKARKYRVQYAETDFAFICRMLEDAGITFYFQEVEGETKLTLTDVPQSNEPRAEKIPFRDNPPPSVDREHVTAVRIGQRVRPGRYTIRDHDYRRPPSYKLMTSAEAPNRGVEAKLERFHYTPGAFLFRADKGDDSPVADDKGKARTDEKEGEVLARKRLEAKRANAKICSFVTNAHDVGPGMVMSMLDHPKSDLGPDRRLLIVESTLSGTRTGEWAHHCEAVSAEVPYRPALVTPKPKVAGVESATVVGPAGEEIHCDEFGRVRVHFHWDRESQMDDSSSCWIHVSQPWGGAGYGGTNLPRIGQEVLVDFLGGDPDRPIIIGRVYTNLQKTPYSLPANKTQSGWKSNSTNATGGYNELMFEDAAGRELLRMQAEKDLNKLVKNDEQVTIGRDRTKLVKNNDDLTVGKDRSKKIVENETVQVGINRTTTVGQNDANTVGVKHSVTISPGEGGGGATSTTHTDGKIVLDTGKGAKITLEGSTIKIEAELIHVVSTSGTEVASRGGDVLITGGPMVLINP